MLVVVAAAFTACAVPVRGTASEFALPAIGRDERLGPAVVGRQGAAPRRHGPDAAGRAVAHRDVPVGALRVTPP